VDPRAAEGTAAPFGHERWEDRTVNVLHYNLRSGQGFKTPDHWKEQIQWEQFLKVAEDAAAQAAKQLSVAIGCEYLGVDSKVQHGQARGPRTYECNPAKWPYTALRAGWACHADIYFRYIAESKDGRRSVTEVAIRVDHLKDRHLRLPSQEDPEAGAKVRRKPRLISGGRRHDIEIDRRCEKEFDDAFKKWYLEAEARQLNEEQRVQEFREIV